MSDERDKAIELLQSQRFAEALPLFLRLSKVDPNDWTLYYMAGQCYRFTGDIHNAIRCLQHATKLNQDEAWIYLAFGIALQINEEYEKAIDALKRAAELSPQMTEVLNSIGLTYRKMGRYPEALEWYSKAEKGLLDKAYNEAMKERAKCFAEHTVDGKKEVVILPYFLEKTREVLRADPEYAILKNNMGVCLAELGARDQAIDQFRQAIDFTPPEYNFSAPIEALAALGAS